MPTTTPKLLSFRHGILTTSRVFLLAVFAGPGLALAQLGLPGFEIWQVPSSEPTEFASAVASGDFNGDGVADMALGAPAAEVDGLQESGRVFLRKTFADGSSTWDYVESCDGFNDRGPEYRMGTSLVFGDFDMDGDDDLAFGMPGATAGGVIEAGAVCVVEGGPWAFSDAPRTRYSQDDLLLEPGMQDRFGEVLAAGDLDGDGYHELAVGVPGEDFPEVLQAFNNPNSGVVQVLFGGATGLNHGEKIVARTTDPVEWQVSNFEEFGSSLAIGDFQGSPVADLAVGTGGPNLFSSTSTVTVFTGGGASALENHTEPWWEGSTEYDLDGTASPGGSFGAALAAGDFNCDGGDDLAISIPDESEWGPFAEEGAVMILYRGGGSLSDVGELVLTGYTFGLEGDPFDHFGAVLTTGDFNADGCADLAIGNPDDDGFGASDSGTIVVAYGSPSGLSLDGFQTLSMAFFAGVAEGDGFGAALAAGKFFGGSGDDLLVGVPFRSVTLGPLEVEDHGVALTVQSTVLHVDGFESGGLDRWSMVSN